MQEKLILKEQVKQLYSLAPLGFAATVMNSLIVFVVMKDVAPLSTLIPWLAAIVVITALRAVLVACYHRCEPDRRDPALWSRRFTVSSVMVGMAWGTIAVFPFSYSLPYQVFIAFVLGGMAAGASSTFSNTKWGFAAFSVPAVLPLALHFLLVPGPFHHAMGLMMLLFLFLLWKISQHHYVTTRTSFYLRFENREMIENLKRAKEDVEALNRQLVEQIGAKQLAEAELRASQDQLERTVEERTADLVRANQKLSQEIEERKQIETALKQAQEKLILAKEAAEAGSLAKSEFLANMSHEMRTPLAGTLGMIRLVLDMEIGQEERQLLDMARRSSESLLRIIGDVLDFSRLEAGVMKFDRKPFAVREAVRTAVEVVLLSAMEKGLTLNWQVEPSVPEMEGDEGRLRQVLINLLGNAVKFTEKGHIDLTVSRFTGAAGGDFALFSIRDTGVGIPEDELRNIFDKFTQIDSSLTRKYGGTGLGLALSRHIVEQLGGRIWAESTVGVGSTFHFTIPTHRPPRN